jgi:peptide/nickel transport system ATP-binding protein
VPEMDENWLDELLDQRGVENIGDAAVSKMAGN